MFTTFRHRLSTIAVIFLKVYNPLKNIMWRMIMWQLVLERYINFNISQINVSKKFRKNTYIHRHCIVDHLLKTPTLFTNSIREVFLLRFHFIAYESSCSLNNADDVYRLLCK